MSSEVTGASLISQVQGEIAKSKRDALKKKLRSKIEDYNSAQEALEAIRLDIVKTIEDSGVDPNGVANLFE